MLLTARAAANVTANARFSRLAFRRRLLFALLRAASFCSFLRPTLFRLLLLGLRRDLQFRLNDHR